MRECENKTVSFLHSHCRSQAHEDTLPPESFPATLCSPAATTDISHASDFLKKII